MYDIYIYIQTRTHTYLYIQTHAHTHIISFAPSITPVPNDIISDFPKPHSNIGFM
jgi:hypothetical protein